MVMMQCFSLIAMHFSSGFFLIWLDLRVLKLDTNILTHLIKYKEISKDHIKLKLIQPVQYGRLRKSIKFSVNLTKQNDGRMGGRIKVIKK